MPANRCCRRLVGGWISAAVFAAFPLGAATFTWDGGHPGQAKWSLSQNWNPNGAPANNGTADLVFTGTVRLTNNADGAWNVNSITFNSFAGAFVIEGDTVTLQGTSLASAIANDSDFAASFANALIVAADQTWSANTANLSFSGTVALGANALTIAGGSDTSMSGVISGTGTLMKSGAGSLTLSGANSYSGGTTVSAGTLIGTTTSLQGNILNNASLVFSQSLNGAYSGVISGTGSLQKQDTGIVTLAGANTFSGATSVEAGTLALGSGGSLADTTAVTVSSGATFQLTAAPETIGSFAGAGSISLGSYTLTAGGTDASTTFSGAITGAGGLGKTGSGTLTLTGANTYTGGTTVSGGILQGNTTSLQGAITNNASVVFDQSGPGTYAGVMSGTGAFTKDNVGSLTLSGQNTYTGATTINAGTLILGNATGTLHDSTALSIASGGTLELGAASETVGSFAGAGSIVLGSYSLTAGGTNASTSFSGGISGTGGLVKTGTGTLTLSGANSYSGGTTVSAGTLQGNTTSLQGNISNNASVVFDQSGSGTYSGIMSGTGSLSKQSAGTLTLTGPNTYSGGTTVSGGLLVGDTTSLQGAIVNNAAVTFDQASSGTYAGAMSGTGSFTKANSGTLTLTGSNTYSGGTTVSAGILQGSTTSLQGNITNNASVVFDQSGAGTYAGTMTGSGALTKLNSGTLTLTGSNTYSGGTTVSAGTLQGTTTSLQGNITNNASVVFDQSGAGTYAGTMTGSGALTKLNTGTLTLTGPNTYSGGTTVSAGTLQGTTTSLQGNITNNASVVFDQSGSGTYSGVVSGSGSLTKQNTGTLTLSGANTYTGATTVDAGMLAVGANNSLSAASNLTLNSGTTLALDGYSVQVATFDYHTAIIDFGATASTNYFLFTGGGASTGTLTVNHFNSGEGDRFAFQTGALGVDSGYVSGVYFYGIGAGVLGATGQSLAGYSGTWDFITPDTTAFVTWDGGHPNSDNWTTGANWDGNSAPSSGFTLKVAFDGTEALAPSMDASYDINTLRFNATAGSFTLNATGSNALTFGGVVPGIIQLSSNAQTVNIPLVLDSTTIVETSGAGALSLNGAISGDGGINKVGTGTLELAGANTYAGETTINAGTAILSHSTALGDTSAGTSVASGAIVQLENDIAVGAEALALNGTLVNASGTNSFGGAISGNGVVNVDGGSLTLSGTSANTYTGVTTVNAGTLQLGKSSGVTALAGNLVIGDGSGAATARLLANGQIADTSAVILQTGGTPTFDLNGYTETIGSIASANASAGIQLGSGTLTTGGDGSSTAFAGVISGSGGSLTKEGTGTFTLSGSNTYTGATTIEEGTLIATHSNALGTTAGGTTVQAGATLQLQNDISIGAEALALDGSLASASGANTYSGAISGTGNVTLQSGTLTLAGTTANTYTGITTVNAGTLDLSKTGSVNALAGNLIVGDGSGSATVRWLAANQVADSSAITLDATGTPVLNLNGYSDTVGSLASSNASAAVQLGSGSLTTGGDNSSTAFAGVISGTGGSLTKTGSGTLTLTGANTYSGGTTVSAGVLQGSTTSLPGNIANNAAVVFDQASAGTYAGVMSGSGSLTKQNAGTLTLSGANTYSGGTTVSAGALQGSTTSLQGNITNNASVVFDQASAGTYAGVMSGSGSLTKQNAGTLTLTGTNTFSGGTTVSAGALQGSTTSLQGNITNNASVVFDQASAGTYAGVMSGTGSLTKQNAGTLTLTGANTYSGGTTVSAGTLQGSTTSLQGNITNNAAVVFDQAGTGTYSGVMSGTGSLTKDNSGTLTLSGSNTYTGATTVSGGSLALGASDALSSSTDLTLSAGTTFSLGGAFSQRVDLLSFTDASIDFGTTGSANYFLLSDIGTATGLLTISNWTSGSDAFGIATNGVSQAFLDNVYFSGINVGVGAVISGSTSSIGGYGNFYTIAPIPTFTWSGGMTTGPAADQDNWSKGNNWVGGIAPAVASVKAIIMAGTTQTTNDMDGAFQIKSLLFRGDAGAFTINSSTGDTLTIGGGGVLNESTNAQTLNVPVYLSAGQTWNAQSGNLLITGATVTNNTYTLTVDGAHDTTISAAIGNGSGGITKVGSGLLTLSGTNTFTGGVSINAGTVSVGSDSNLGDSSGALAFGGGTLRTTAGITAARSVSLAAAGGTIDSNGFNSTFSGVISGSGGLTKTGAGTLTLSGTNTFTGGVTINTGTVAVGSEANLGNSSGTLTFAGGTLQATGGISSTRAVVLSPGGGTFDSNVYTSTLAGVVSGSGGLTKTGVGTLVLTGANTYSGGTTVSTGALQGSTTSLQGNISNNASVVFDQASNGTYSGVISGNGSLTKQGVGTLTLSGANTFTGGTSITGGTLRLGISNAISSTGALTISSGATFDLNNLTQTIGALAGAGDISLGTGRLVVGAGNATSTFAGAIAGTGVFEKIGTGTLTFDQSFSFAGELKLTGGTLALAGVNLTVDTLRISGNTILDFGSSVASVLTATSVILEDGAILTINNWVDLQDFFYASGALFGLNTTTMVTTPATPDVRGVPPQDQISFGGFSNESTAWQSYDRQITPAPEPATYGAIMTGMVLALLGYRWRQRIPAGH